jgi:cobalt-zinc-cadmium efflux system outer membrane protein
MRSHLQIDAAQARVAAADALRLQAGLRPNPRLFLQSENSRFWGSPGFVYSRDADSFAYASQVLETGGKRQKREQFQGQAVHRTQLERDLTGYRILYRVHLAYWTALGAARNFAILRETLSNFGRIVQYHRDRVREGAMAEADLLRVQLEYERLGLSLQTAEYEAVRTRTHLYHEMGVADAGPVVLAERLEALQEVPGVGLESAIQDRIDLRLARQLKTQAEANVDLQRANAKPDPELLAGYKRSNGFDTLIAGLQINLPIRNRNQGQIASAVAEVRAADSGMRAASIAAETEISAARTTYEARLRMIQEIFPPLLARASEGSRIAQAAYREGGLDLLRLLDAERARIDAEASYYRALLDYQLAAVDLKAALGVLR